MQKYAAIVVDRYGSETLIEEGLSSRELFLSRPLYCAIKPVVALEALRLLPDVSCELASDRFGVDYGGLDYVYKHTTLGDLLEHRYAMAYPTLMRMFLTPPAERERRLLRAFALAQSSPPQYSEVLAWWCVSRALDGVAGSGWVAELQRRLDQSLPARLWLVPDGELLGLEREAVAMTTCGNSGLPLLHERELVTRLTVAPYLGGFGSAFALAWWYHIHVARTWDSGCPLGEVSTLKTTHRAKQETRGRYVLGFQARWPGMKPLTFLGHMAAGGSVLAGFEPDTGSSVSVVTSVYFHELTARERAVRGALSALLSKSSVS